MSITKDTETNTPSSICPECRKSKETKTSEVQTEGKDANGSWFDKEKALTYTKWGGLAVAGACAAPMVIGFGTGGIVAGSIAAAWQSSIGNVMVGSTFATLQSLGATGVFVTGASAGATATAGAVVAEKVAKKKSEANEDETDKEEGKEDYDDEPGAKSQDPQLEEKHNMTSEEYKCEKCGKVFFEDAQDKIISQ